jgi:2-dehydro-3-deoxyphosphooctonate aldolase (KDO 8-P synthase)
LPQPRPFATERGPLLLAAAKTGRTPNVKKGRFLALRHETRAPRHENVADNLAGAGGDLNVLVTERDVSFGYSTLV